MKTGCVNLTLLNTVFTLQTKIKNLSNLLVSFNTLESRLSTDGYFFSEETIFTRLVQPTLTLTY